MLTIQLLALLGAKKGEFSKDSEVIAHIKQMLLSHPQYERTYRQVLKGE